MSDIDELLPEGTETQQEQDQHQDGDQANPAGDDSGNDESNLSPEQGEAEFAAGFDSINNPELDEGSGDEGEEPPEPPAYVSKSELEEYLAKIQAEQRRLHGQYGTVNDRINQALNQKAATPAAIVLESVREEYPELAERIEQDFAKLFAANPPPPPEPAAAPTSADAQPNNDMDPDLQQIADAYPGWQEKFNSPEFQAYVGSLSDAERNAMDTNPSAFVMQMAKHDGLLQRQQSTNRSRQQRLQGSEPAGRGGVAPPNSRRVSDDNAFEAGFNAVRGGRL